VDHSSNQEASGERTVMGSQVIIVSPDAVLNAGPDGLNFFTLVRVIWRAKILVISVTALFGVASIAYALLAEEWFTADTLLVSAEDNLSSGIAGALAGQLGGLAGLAGVSMDGGGTVEPLAVLSSRGFTRSFIEDEQLLSVLFQSDWDDPRQSWKTEDPKDWPDIQDAVEFFDEEVRSVSEDLGTGLVTLSIEWTDANEAARWANLLVARLNNQMRERSLRDAQRNVEYLTGALNSTSVVTLQQSISSLLETEYQKLMLARGNEEFAFRVIDHAEPPNKRSRPNRPLVVILSVLLGGMLSVLIVIFRHAASVNSRSTSPLQK
jgi:uncharacterized protein involved in exopolysaccharide biosynthesis